MTQQFKDKDHPTAIAGTDGFPMTASPGGTPVDKFVSFDELVTLFLAKSDTGTMAKRTHGGAPLVNVIAGGATPALDIALGNIQKLTLSVDASPAITHFTNGEFTLVLIQPADDKAVTWPAAVKWAGGTPPTISGNNKTHVLKFLTADGGTTIYGWPVVLDAS